MNFQYFADVPVWQVAAAVIERMRQSCSALTLLEHLVLRSAAEIVGSGQ